MAALDNQKENEMNRVLRLQTLGPSEAVLVGASTRSAGLCSTDSAGLCSTDSAGLCSTNSAGLCGADTIQW